MVHSKGSITHWVRSRKGNSITRSSHVVGQCGHHQEEISLIKAIKQKAALFAQGTTSRYIFLPKKCILLFTSESVSPVAVFLTLHILHIH